MGKIYTYGWPVSEMNIRKNETEVKAITCASAITHIRQSLLVPGSKTLQRRR